MHIAAKNPFVIKRNDLSVDEINRERNILLKQACNSGKDKKILSKIVEGRLNKFYQDVVLLEQIYIIDGERTISQVISDFAKDIKTDVQISSFISFILGSSKKTNESVSTTFNSM